MLSIVKTLQSKLFQVCQQVTTTECKLIGYVDCQMDQVDQDYRSYKYVHKFYETVKCDDKNVTKTYTTKKAKCENVTKHNCVTQWEVSASGEKVGI